VSFSIQPHSSADATTTATANATDAATATASAAAAATATAAASRRVKTFARIPLQLHEYEEVRQVLVKRSGYFGPSAMKGELLSVLLL
jgi:hypothetical protein